LYISIYAYEDDDELIQNTVACALSKGHPETSRPFILQLNASVIKNKESNREKHKHEIYMSYR